MELRQPFPNLNALLPALRDGYPLSTTGTQCQPEEQVESNQRPFAAAPILSPSISMPAAASSHRDPAHQIPPAASGLRDPPNAIPAVERSRGYPAHQRPAATSGSWNLPNTMPAAASSLRDPAHQIPPTAPILADPSLLPYPVPISQAARLEPSLQMPDTAAPTLAEPSLPYPVPISQGIRREPSLSMPAPALSGPSPIDVNNSSTDAIHGSPEANEPSAVARSTGQDITDHGANNNARTGVPVESAPRSQLMADGSFLDPDKYEAVKPLGCGGFAKVINK